jgi:ribA/ribD-fused uncharacterized protein
MTKQSIDSFSGEYRYLSNFWKVPIPLENLWYPSVEHAYQAAKTLDETEKKVIALAATPGEAKKRGKKLVLREDWESVKVDFMRYLVWYKFTMYPDLGKMLLDTGDAELIEGNTWNDTFWGVCNGVGQNWLGRILMETRGRLKLHTVSRTASGPIDKTFYPGPGRVFVFGSNLSGVHGAGAAKTAKEQYGAIPGVGEGLMPDDVTPGCYALPTKDENIQTLSLERIKEYVDRFIMLAWERQDLTFFVTRIGCGLAGYTDVEVAPLFELAPPNCELPYGWEKESDDVSRGTVTVPT